MRGFPLYTRKPGRSAAWLARLLWEQEVPGSNPGVPTSTQSLRRPSAFLLCEEPEEDEREDAEEDDRLLH
jgi:hypothetical protein